MKFLLDTNIFIPLEPTRQSEIESGTARAADIVRLVLEAGHRFYVHPAIQADVARDPDPERRELRRQLLLKYPSLPHPPDPTSALDQAFGSPDRGSNDWVDLQLTAAVAGDAVDYLVTEDRGLGRRANASRLGDRVCTLEQIAQVVRGFQSKPSSAPTPAERVIAHQLDVTDPIFHSLRSDYDGFDRWLQKCKRAHRACILIRGSDGRYAALCILKDESGGEHGLLGRLLKLCTFKVSSKHFGFRFGELLLKAIFEHAEAAGHTTLYVEAFEKHVELLELLDAFGFEAIEARTPRGELVLVKRLRSPTTPTALEPLDFNRRYGPRSLRVAGVPGYVIPILPKYHRLLFPEAERQLSLVRDAHPFGNALRKAYLCHSPIRRITPGSFLVFYRSQREQAATVLGIAEDTLVSSDPDHLARFVGKRTVYSMDEITDMSRDRQVLAILLRQSRVLDSPIPAQELLAAGLINRAPQSIVTISENAAAWLATRLDALY